MEMLELIRTGGTLDATHCQKETAQAIRDKGADYLLPPTHASEAGPEALLGRRRARLCRAWPAPAHYDLARAWPNRAAGLIRDLNAQIAPRDAGLG